MNITTAVLALLVLGIGAGLGAMAARLRAANGQATTSADLAVQRQRAKDLAVRTELIQREASAASQRAAAAEAELAATQAELRAHEQAAAERERLLASRDAELRDSFRALSADALARNNEAFVQLAEARIKEATATFCQKVDGNTQQHQQAISALLDPVTQTLQRLDGQLRTAEKEREGAYAELRAQVGAMHRTSEQLQAETKQLVNALRAPQVRGRWGELQLERIVQLAGMVEHCDFNRQVVATGRDGDTDNTIRPDLVVHLSGDKQVVVDAKVPFAAYLEAMESTDPTVRDRRLAAHARHLRAHIDSLSAKSYWSVFEPSPEFVVLFVPGDPFLAAALDTEPALLEYAFSRNVVVATPTTLIALLRTVAYTWRQEALARNAAQVHALGRELHARLATMGGHVNKLGRQLGSAVDSYNKAVSSLESRVLVTARRFTDLQVADEELATPEQLECTPRIVQAPELVASAADALIPLHELRGERGERGDQDAPAATGANGGHGSHSGHGDGADRDGAHADTTRRRRSTVGG